MRALLTIALAAAALSGAAAAADRKAEQVARQFLEALVVSDCQAAHRLRAEQPENLYGPCPLTSMPRPGAPGVKAHRAMVPFQGRTKAGPAGMLVELTRFDRPREHWLVSRVYQSDGGPPVKSPWVSQKQQDRTREAAALAVARRFIAAWMKADYPALAALTYDWSSRVDPPKSSTSLWRVDLSTYPERDGSVRVDFKGTILVGRILPRRAGGSIRLVREGEQYKVRFFPLISGNIDWLL